MKKTVIVMAVAALGLVTGIKADLNADIDRETAAQEAITKELTRAYAAYSSHQSNWVQLIKTAIRHEQTHLPRARAVIARARAQGYPQAAVEQAEQTYDTLEANMNTMITELASQGISVD